MDAKDLEKIEGIVKMIDNFILPLAEQGAAMTKNPIDDMAVAFLKGGVPALKKKIEEITQKASTS